MTDRWDGLERVCKGEFNGSPYPFRFASPTVVLDLIRHARAGKAAADEIRNDPELLKAALGTLTRYDLAVKEST